MLEFRKNMNDQMKKSSNIHENTPEMAGVLGYHIGDQVVPEMKKMGYRGEETMEISLDMLFENKEGFNKFKILESLMQLACDIVDKHPECKVIFASSWLFDRTEMDKNIPGLNFINDMSRLNWMQFVGKDNQINLKRLEYLIKNGEPEFEGLLCYMSVEDYLKNFLPKERRGKIMLKDLNPEYTERRSALEREAEMLHSTWDNMLKTEQNFDEYISQFPNLLELLQKLEYKDKIIDFWRDMAQKRMSWVEVKKEEEEVRFEKEGKEINQYLEKSKFVDREVIIE
jgi:hypothetical protein